MKTLPKLLEDRDKTVREETKMLVVEVYRWIGAALKPQLANLKPVQVYRSSLIHNLHALELFPIDRSLRHNQLRGHNSDAGKIYQT